MLITCIRYISTERMRLGICVRWNDCDISKDMLASTIKLLSYLYISNAAFVVLF